MTENWIWLPESLYPDRQKTVYSAFVEKNDEKYTVAEFQKKYIFKKNISLVRFRFSADTKFQLFCNEDFLATGPACASGDFLGNDKPRKNFYATEMRYTPESNCLDIFARVEMMPVKLCDYSNGHGGFMLSAEVFFSDGSRTDITTDESWLVRYNGAYCAPYQYDSRILPDQFVNAQKVCNIWHTLTAPIPQRTEKRIVPTGGIIRLDPQEEKEIVLPFDLIYAGFLHIYTKTDGIVSLDVSCRELDEYVAAQSLVFKGNGEYRDFELQSVGNLFVKAVNHSNSASEISVSLISTCYPVNEVCKTETNDEELNRILEVCAHTLKYCRQTQHLDSPRHCEPLACTGDYYIESLMTAFSFGDMRLAEFDILRTAELLENNDGRMFHTTYSLIWVLMLYDIYMISGNTNLLYNCTSALFLLLNRFQTYIGSNGLIETPPDYMFVDWIYIDGISMHHPPKALGQTCLNMFYYGALEAAEKIFSVTGEHNAAEECLKKRENLRLAINAQLFDNEKGIYFEGLNTPSPNDMIYKYLPQNTNKRYYLKHSNILAAYFGICGDDTARALIEKIMNNEIPGDYQPYFAHYLLEAILRLGLREKYTLSVLDQWKAPIAECSKGLAEGFIPPEPGYPFDHSHAWGGTPLYSLPKALLGLEIILPAYEEISINPSLLGLQFANVELPTPFGKIICKLRENKEPEIICPDEIKVRQAGV